MSAWQAIALVARREIRERLRSRVFIVSTALMLLIVGGSSALNGALSKKPTYRVAVVAPAPGGLDAALQRAAIPFDAKVRLTVVASPAAARARLDAKKLDAVILLASDRLVFRSSVDSAVAAVADTAVRSVRNHLPPSPELGVATLRTPEKQVSDAETLVAFLGSLVLLATIALYGQWVLSGVVEEKSNRVVELVLATVQPRHLMAGKVIGIGLLGFAQVALVGGLGAVLLAAGVFDAPASLGAGLALIIPWFALGFALYAVAYAAAGALASGQQDANSAGTTVAYTLSAVYFLCYVTLMSDVDGLLANVLTIFPLTAPFVVPERSIAVGVPLWEHVVAVVLTLVAVYALVRLAGRVYALGILRSGARLNLRAAVRLARQSY